MSFNTEKISADILGNDNSILLARSDTLTSVMVHKFEVSYEDGTSKADAEADLKKRAVELLQDAIDHLRQ